MKTLPNCNAFTIRLRFISNYRAIFADKSYFSVIQKSHFVQKDATITHCASLSFGFIKAEDDKRRASCYNRWVESRKTAAEPSYVKISGEFLMKRRTVLKLAGVACLLPLSSCSASAAQSAASSQAGAPLVVAMELAYPPFETKDDAGNPTGISVDFAKAFGESVGREVEIVDTAWDGLIPSLQTGKADMVVSSMTITEERKKTVDFSDPYANSLLAILANKDSGISTIDDLNQTGKKVAVKNGSTGHVYAQNNLQNAELIVLADESACVTEVAQGKADGFLYDQLTIYRNWQKNLDTTTAIFVPYQDVEKWGVAVKKGNTALLEQLNAFIRDFTADGGFDRLSETYMPEEKKAFEELGFRWFFDLS